MYPNRSWWAERGYVNTGDLLTRTLTDGSKLCMPCISKTLPNGWKVLVSYQYEIPPVDGNIYHITIIEPDGNTSTVTFAMTRSCAIDPMSMLSSLLKICENEVFKGELE